MNPRVIPTAAMIVLSAAVQACSHKFDVPMPTVSAPAANALPPMERATIAVPVSIALATLRQRIDSVFPPTDSLDRAKCSAIGGLVCHQYVYRRDSLDLTMGGDRVSLYTRLRFRGRVALPGLGGIASCGYEPEPMRRAEMRLSTTLYWRSDWRLATRGTLFTPEILDPCQVTVLRVDATPLMRRIIDGQVARLRQQFDSIVPTVANLKPAADSMWRMLQRPLAVDSASTVWLSMGAEGASLAPLVATDGDVTTAIVLTARPRIVVGARPTVDARPLPTLTLATQTSGIHVPVEIQLPFDEVGRLATAALSGEVAGKGIRVGQINVWGVGDTAVVKVGVEGKMTGSFFLLGRLGYDTATKSIIIRDLKYTIESANKMSSIKATLGAPRIRHALDEATGHGRLAVGAQLDRFRGQLTAELNRDLAPGVTLTGGITDVRILRLVATQNAFVLRVVFDGDARIHMD